MAWLPGFKYRRKFTVDKDKVDSTLSNFPLAVHAGTSTGLGNTDLSDILTELSDNDARKIAITLPDGVTQCYIEVEDVDSINIKALFHVLAPSVTAATDTEFYFYYDSLQHDNVAYAGIPGSSVAANVWDANFVGVWHMSQDPSGGSDSILDSSGNGNHGTPVGSMVAADLVDGFGGGKALNFNGSGQYINVAHSSELAMADAQTLESFWSATNVSNEGILCKTSMSNDQGSYSLTVVDVAAGHYYRINNGTKVLPDSGSPLTNTWTYLAGSYDKINMRITVNTVMAASLPVTDAIDTDTDILRLGAYYSGSHTFPGDIGELRISDIARSDAWLKTTQYGLKDNLITWSAKETKAGSEKTVDFTTFSGTDQNNDITLTRNQVYFDGMQRQAECFFMKDYGADYFNTWEILFDSEITLCGDQAQVTLLALTNTRGTANDWISANDGIGVVTHRNGGTFDLYLYDYDNDNSDKNSQSKLVMDHYWFRFKNVGTTATLEIYSDSDRKILVDTLTITSSGNNKRYASIGSREFSGSSEITAYTRNVEIVYPFQVLATNWLTGFDNRRALTIPASVTAITLENFPVALHIGESVGLGATDLSGVLTGLTDSERKKIAITMGDGVSQFPVEIERWTSASTLGMLHAKIPILNGGTDNILYLYYGGSLDSNDFWVGDTGEALAGEVWDSNFVAVWHMNQAPGGANSILDSVTLNNGTPNNMESGDLINGEGSAYALTLDGSDEYINFGSASTLDDLTLKTIEAFHRPASLGDSSSGRIIDKATASDNGWTFLTATQGHFYQHDSSGGLGQWHNNSSITLDTWHYAAIRHDISNINNDPLFFVNGSSVAPTELTAPSGTFDAESGADVLVGDRVDLDRSYSGRMGDIRLSNIFRSVDWLGLTNHSLLDTLGTYGVEEEAPASDPAAAWLGTYAYRRKFTVGASVTASTLTNFPVALHIGAAVGKLGGRAGSDLTGTLASATGLTDSISRRLAVTTNSGTTECFVEIERWTSASTLGMLHFIAPSVSAVSNTEFFLYWDSAASDNTKVGQTGSTSAASVWDSNFVAVWHLNRNPATGGGTQYDSTLNSNNGTPNGSMTSGDFIDGLGSAKAIDFDGGDDKITCGTGATISGDLTLESIVNTNNVALDWQGIISKVNGTDANYVLLLKQDELRFNFYNGAWNAHDTVAENLANDTDYYLGCSFDSSGNSVSLFVNGASTYQGAETADLIPNASIVEIGNDGGSQFFDGHIGEVRISKTVRNPAWIDATYNTLFDTYGFWAVTEAYTGSTGSTAVTGGTPPAPTGNFGSITINNSRKSVDSCYISVSQSFKRSQKVYIAINNQWKLVS